jgi:RHS repeat-associated protein
LSFVTESSSRSSEFIPALYNYFRDYDPSTERYVQSDPIGLAGGISTFAYVEANPISGIDLYGLMGGGGSGAAGRGGVSPFCGSRPTAGCIPRPKPSTECMKKWISDRYGPLGLYAVEEASLYSMFPDSGNLLDGGPAQGVTATAAWGAAKAVGVGGGIKVGEIMSVAAANPPAVAIAGGVTKTFTGIKNAAGVLGPGLLLWATTTNELAKQACECAK